MKLHLRHIERTLVLKSPSSVEGYDFSEYLMDNLPLPDTTTLISCVQPFGQWTRFKHKGKEYRGLVSLRYTYTRDLNGPWLLFDNLTDPYQQNNLVGNPDFAGIQEQMNDLLTEKLKVTGDQFLPGMEYVDKWGYTVDDTETIPYSP